VQYKDELNITDENDINYDVNFIDKNINDDEETIVNTDKSLTFAYAYKCTGSSHTRENKQCQDACKILMKRIKEKQVIILAVGDGHGNSKYDLSEYGSKIVVDDIADELVKFYDSFLENKAVLGQNFDMFKILKSEFPERIVRRWKDDVIKHYEENYCSDNLTFDNNEKKNIIKRYGTTALFALIIPEGMVIGQIGDGDITIANEDTVEIPLPTSDELLANVTFSMTSDNAYFLWNISQIAIDSRTMIMLSTDGLSNSYASDESFFRFIRSLFDNLIVCNNIEDIGNINIPDYIKRASFNGSGDDITIAFAIIDPKMFIQGENIC
jgi:serine/threonine protein phosphatase PrpC